jgi:hypothetical protein
VSSRLQIHPSLTFNCGIQVELLWAEPENRVRTVENLSTSPLPLEDLLHEIDLAERSARWITKIESFCRERICLGPFYRPNIIRRGGYHGIR